LELSGAEMNIAINAKTQFLSLTVTVPVSKKRSYLAIPTSADEVLRFCYAELLKALEKINKTFLAQTQVYL
jgi:hypothetical protein